MINVKTKVQMVHYNILLFSILLVTIQVKTIYLDLKLFNLGYPS